MDALKLGKSGTGTNSTNPPNMMGLPKPSGVKPMNLRFKPIDESVSEAAAAAAKKPDGPTCTVTSGAETLDNSKLPKHTANVNAAVFTPRGDVALKKILPNQRGILSADHSFHGSSMTGAGIASGSMMSFQPNAFRRSVTFNDKPEILPSPGYSYDGAASAGATGGGDAPFLGASNSLYPKRGLGTGFDLRAMECCIKDLIPSLNAAAQSSGDNNLTAASTSISASNDLASKPQHINTIPVKGGNSATGFPSLISGGLRYSRKVFIGGLPPDIDEDEITISFRRFGPLVVDWPHKAESNSYFPPKGYAFLLFQNESSVQHLIDACVSDDDKLYLYVSSSTIKDKPVQIRPWRLADANYVLDATITLDPRKTVFVGGVPRPIKAHELALVMDRLYGGVCYAGIDIDPELKYPKGAGRVAFSNQQSYIAAISARFMQLQHGDIDKRVEVKPYVLDDQMCDLCEGTRSNGKFAPYFCANVTCLQYYCDFCWTIVHNRPGREYHKPLVKEGADRPRSVPFRWC